MLALDRRSAQAGKQNQGYDLELPSGEGLSIKAAFSSRGGQIRLINSLGKGTRTWVDATLFPMTGWGSAAQIPRLPGNDVVVGRPARDSRKLADCDTRADGGGEPACTPDSVPGLSPVAAIPLG